MATILIAEDDCGILRVCAMWLTREGHTVLEASNGQQAMELLAQHPVDVLVSDVDMPALSGSELVMWWRDTRKSTRPVILFTASCRREDLEVLMHDYDVCYLPKPFSPTGLISTVDRLLAGAGAAEYGPACTTSDSRGRR